MVRELRDRDKTGGHLEGGKGVATAATQPVLSRTTVENYFLLVIIYMYTVQAIQFLRSLVKYKFSYKFVHCFSLLNIQPSFGSGLSSLDL